MRRPSSTPTDARLREAQAVLSRRLRWTRRVLPGFARAATAVFVCIALNATTYPARALAAVTEFERFPERVLLRHADELGLSSFDRTLLERRAAGPSPAERYVPPVLVPDFDRRLESLAQALEATPAGAPGLASLRAAFQQDMAAMETEWARLEALWSDPKTKPVRDRLVARRARARADFARLERVMTGTPAAQGAAASEALEADRQWLRALVAARSRPDYDSSYLPFARRKAAAPIPPATSDAELQKRLGATASATEASGAATASGAAAAASIAPPGPADLAETPEVQFTPDIQALAASLGNNPVAIFNWVRDHVTWAAVTGSIQGADHCLQTRSCTDVDTASLMIALLRTSGIPARYRMGTVDIPEALAMNWVGGADTLQVAGDVLATGGIPGVIFNGDRLRSERVWVQAFVDMNPSRGAVQVEGDTWVDLDPAFKQYENTDPIDISGSVPSDPTVLGDVLATATVDPATGSLTSMDTSLFSDAFASEMAATDDYFTMTAPSTPLKVVTGSDAIIPTTDTQLPGTLPFQIVSAVDGFAEVTPAMRHQLTIRLETSGGGTIFSYGQSLAELAGKKLAITYEPASPADQSALEALFQGVTDLSQVPTTIDNSVQFQASLRVDDAVVASGGVAGYGDTQHLVLDFDGPLGPRPIPASLTVGGYYAIGLDLEQISPKLRDRVDAEADAIRAADMDPQLLPTLSAQTTAGTLLQAGILNWFSDRDMRDWRLAKGSRVISQRLPSSGLYFNALAVSTLFGLPVSATAAGATLDIANDYGYVVAMNGDPDLAVSVAFAQGQTGSEMEASVQETSFSTPANPVGATSTMRILQQANDEGIPIYRITNANSSTILPLLSYPSSDIQLVTDALAQGREVIIPQTQVVFAGNPVTGLITQDVSTGSAAYLISGGLGVHAGGLAEFTQSTTFSVIVAVFFAIVAILALFSVIGAGVALFAAIMANVIGIIMFFISWADIVDNQPDRGLTIGEAAAGLGIIALFSYGLVTGIIGLFTVATLGSILFGLAIAIVSIFISAWLTSIIVGLLDDLFESGREVLYAAWPGTGREGPRTGGPGLGGDLSGELLPGWGWILGV